MEYQDSVLYAISSGGFLSLIRQATIASIYLDLNILNMARESNSL